MPLTPPQNLEAEQGVLGAILLSDRSLHPLVIEEGLRPEHFYRERHQTIFAAILRLYQRNEPIDPLTIAEDLRQHGQLQTAGGKAAIDELTTAVPLVGNARRYAQIVRETAVRREILKITYEAQRLAAAGEGDVADLINHVSGRLLALRANAERSHIRLLSDVEFELAEQASEMAGKPDTFIGLKTGLVDLDAVLNGLRGGALYVIGARPSAGKTALALQIGFNVAIDQGQPTMIASLEMADTEIGQRRLANAAAVNLDQVTQPSRLDQRAVQRIFSHAIAEARQSPPLWIVDPPTMTLMELRSEALELHRRLDGGLKLLIVDYLQLLTPAPGTRASDTRATIVGQFSRGLKQLARELNVPIIALSQLSRESERRHDRRPTLSDLRESGDIENDADVVMLVHREDYYDREQRPGEVDLIIAKNRQGRRDLVVTLAFQAAFQRFRSLARE